MLLKRNEHSDAKNDEQIKKMQLACWHLFAFFFQYIDN